MNNKITDLKKIYFDGYTYRENLDLNRLKSSLEKVFSLMSDGKPRSLKEIASITNGSESGVSARLRDLRKVRFGGHEVKSTHKGNGIWLYQLTPSFKNTINKQLVFL